MNLNSINKIAGSVAMLLSIGVAIPLTIKVMVEGGGPWGFEIVSLAILVPLSCYLLFGVAGLITDDLWQRRVFIFAHFLTIAGGIGGYFIFPVYPFGVTLVPVGLAIAGIASHKKLKWFLLTMVLITILLNVILLKWELDFGRTIPLLQIFQSSKEIVP